MTVGLGWRGCWRIARRDLHPGFRGLRLLFVCLFLGVATLATIGNLTAAITGEIASKGRLLLGGDVEVALSQREASGEEKAAFRRRSEEHTSELQSLMRISYAVFSLKTKHNQKQT